MAEITVSKTKIRDFIQSIESGKYQLPCFQRDFKWNPSKIKSLLNSIQHEYPAGSLLFLKVNSDNPLIPCQGFKYTNSDDFTEKNGNVSPRWSTENDFLLYRFYEFWILYILHQLPRINEKSG